MMFRLKIFLFLASLTLAPSIAEASVHRRNVGPVILDLGALPSRPDTTGESQPPVEAGTTPSPPQPEGNPETGIAPPEPVAIPATYPSHRQPLGALLVTMHSPDKAEETPASSILMADMETQAPVLVAYYHPTLAGDFALLTPPVETTPTPAATAEPPAAEAAPVSGADLKIDAEAAPPVDRLRSLVVWVWRLLFVLGFGALAVTLLRRRRQSRQSVPSTPSDDAPAPEFSPQLLRSGVLQETATSLETAADSSSIRTEKSGAIRKPETGSRAFGLIEPGAARRAATRGGAIRERDPKRQQAP